MFGFMAKSLMILLCLVHGMAPVDGALQIEIKKGVCARIPIGFLGFQDLNIPAENTIESIVKNDLLLSGAFTILPDPQMKNPVQDALGFPDFDAWPAQSGTMIVQGNLTTQGDMIIAELKVYDAILRRPIGRTSITRHVTDSRLLAHLIANAVYKLLTGEDGVFDTQIIFAAQSGDPRRKSSRIAVIDQDGANGRFLTAPGEYCFLPKASPISPTIGYAFFNQRRALLRLHNLDNGKKTVLPITGIGASIEFSPQSPNILFSDANEGSTTLKLHDVQTGATRSLNRGYGGIAVSPSYSPDGTTFVVSSDQDLTDTRTVQKRRIGAPKLYVIQQNTGFATLISKGKGSYLSPAWSPDGQNIAFVKRSKGNYYIGVMDINGGNERMLACDHVIDSPSWAPNGRMVIFAAQQRRFGSFHLYIVDLTGRSLRKLPIVCNGTPQGGNHPSWRKYKSAAYKKLQAY